MVAARCFWRLRTFSRSVPDLDFVSADVRVEPVSVVEQPHEGIDVGGAKRSPDTDRRDLWIGDDQLLVIVTVELRRCLAEASRICSST